MANDGDDDSTSLISFSMDIIELILSGMPVKSLLRFKAVSKSWNDLISSPRFINSHLQRSKINSASQFLFLGERTRWSYHLVRLEDGRFETELVLDLPDYFVECSCDDLVLCSGLDRVYSVWNPSCRKHTLIYYPHYYKYDGACGLCRDRVTHDVKIVIVNQKYYVVYSSNAKSWTRKEFYLTGNYTNSSGLCVDGALYWLWFIPGYRIQYIVCFDSGNDELKTMEKPQCLKDTDRIQLVCFKDRLCIWFYNLDTSVVQIWSRNRSCWTGLMTIEDVPTPFHYLRPLYFQENMILIQVDTARFVIYRPIEKTFEEFEDESMKEIRRIVGYMESLVLIPVQKTLPHRKRKSIYSRSYIRSLQS